MKEAGIRRPMGHQRQREQNRRESEEDAEHLAALAVRDLARRPSRRRIGAGRSHAIRPSTVMTVRRPNVAPVDAPPVRPHPRLSAWVNKSSILKRFFEIDR